MLHVCILKLDFWFIGKVFYFLLMINSFVRILYYVQNIYKNDSFTESIYTLYQGKLYGTQLKVYLIDIQHSRNITGY